MTSLRNYSERQKKNNNNRKKGRMIHQNDKEENYNKSNHEESFKQVGIGKNKTK